MVVCRQLGFSAEGELDLVVGSVFDNPGMLHFLISAEEVSSRFWAPLTGMVMTYWQHIHVHTPAHTHSHRCYCIAAVILWPRNPTHLPGQCAMSGE